MTSVSVLMPNEYHCEVIKVTPNAPMLKVSAYNREIPLFGQKAKPSIVFFAQTLLTYLLG